MKKKCSFWKWKRKNYANMKKKIECYGIRTRERDHLALPIDALTVQLWRRLFRWVKKKKTNTKVYQPVDCWGNYAAWSSNSSTKQLQICCWCVSSKHRAIVRPKLHCKTKVCAGRQLNCFHSVKNNVSIRANRSLHRWSRKAKFQAFLAPTFVGKQPKS